MSETDETDVIEALPDLLRWFAEGAGLGAALRLAIDFGGTALYLPDPDYLDDDHRLVRSLGMDAARILCRDFGPAEVEIPLNQRFRTKKAQIARLLHKGYTGAELARLLGTTERHVRRAKSQLRKQADNQPDLFAPDARPGHADTP